MLTVQGTFSKRLRNCTVKLKLTLLLKDIYIYDVDLPFENAVQASGPAWFMEIFQ